MKLRMERPLSLLNQIQNSNFNPIHFQFYEVGGCIRDELLGIQSKDVDFAVVADNSFTDVNSAFNELTNWMEINRFNIFESRPQFLTIRAQVPEDHPLRSRTIVADFVLARRDGPSSDGRRPDWVIPGTLLDDLSRRDFTVNAIARSQEGQLIDPFGGREHLKTMELHFVGDPNQRISEDGLRVMRAFRFVITKGFTFNDDHARILHSEFAADMLRKVSVERIREELNKMLRVDTLRTLSMFGGFSTHTKEAIFRNGLRLEATLAH